MRGIAALVTKKSTKAEIWYSNTATGGITANSLNINAGLATLDGNIQSQKDFEFTDGTMTGQQAHIKNNWDCEACEFMRILVLPSHQIEDGSAAATSENMAANMAVPDLESHVHTGHPTLLEESMVLLDEGVSAGAKRRAIDVGQATTKLTQAHASLRQEEKTLVDLLTRAKGRLAALEATFRTL